MELLSLMAKESQGMQEQQKGMKEKEEGNVCTSEQDQKRYANEKKYSGMLELNGDLKNKRSISKEH